MLRSAERQLLSNRTNRECRQCAVAVMGGMGPRDTTAGEGAQRRQGRCQLELLMLDKSVIKGWIDRAHRPFKEDWLDTSEASWTVLAG